MAAIYSTAVECSAWHINWHPNLLPKLTQDPSNRLCLQSLSMQAHFYTDCIMLCFWLTLMLFTFRVQAANYPKTNIVCCYIPTRTIPAGILVILYNFLSSPKQSDWLFNVQKHSIATNLCHRHMTPKSDFQVLATSEVITTSSLTRSSAGSHECLAYKYLRVNYSQQLILHYVEMPAHHLTVFHVYMKYCTSQIMQ